MRIPQPPGTVGEGSRMGRGGSLEAEASAPHPGPGLQGGDWGSHGVGLAESGQVRSCLQMKRGMRAALLSLSGKQGKRQGATGHG